MHDRPRESVYRQKYIFLNLFDKWNIYGLWVVYWNTLVRPSVRPSIRPSETFVTKISAHTSWIDLKFGMKLHIDGAYVVSDFCCYWITTSCLTNIEWVGVYLARLCVQHHVHVVLELNPCNNIPNMNKNRCNFSNAKLLSSPTTFNIYIY